MQDENEPEKKKKKKIKVKAKTKKNRNKKDGPINEKEEEAEKEVNVEEEKDQANETNDVAELDNPFVRIEELLADLNLDDQPDTIEDNGNEIDDFIAKFDKIRIEGKE